MNALDEEWLALCETAWRYQWVKAPIEFSEEIVETLYNCSQGITGIMLNVFCTAQVEAIESRLEAVTPQLLKNTFTKLFKPLHPVIDALKSGNPANLMKFDDLYLGFVNRSDLSSAHSRLEKLYQLQGVQPALFADEPPKPLKSKPRKSVKTTEDMLDKLAGDEMPCDLFKPVTRPLEPV
jgi:hypothetical protein